MPAWILISVAGTASMAVLALMSFAIGARRYEGQHVLDDVQAEYDAWVAEQGSMILAEEHPLEPLPAPVVDPEPWRQQMAEELAPEALDDDDEPLSAPPPSHPVWRNPKVAHGPEKEEIVLPAYGGWVSGPCLDPGPGDGSPSLTPSPGPDQCSQWLAEQLAVLRAWSVWQQEKAAILGGA